MGRITVLGLLLTGAVYLRAGTFTAFGPKDYVRGSGSPVTVTDTFSVLNPTTQYTLKVFNGGLENSQTELVSSSIVSVNGLQVIGPSNFNQNVKEVDVPIILQTANTLSVQVRGQPGGTLAIQIVGVDSDPPVIKSTISPLPNAAGWNNSKVTVTFTCTDSTSGVATCPQAQTVTADGASQVISGTATDNAGNSASTSVTVNLDQTAPSIRAAVSPAPNAAGWNNTNLTVAFTCLDVTSGVASCPPPQTVSSEGPNQIVSGTVADIAGNTASTSITINLDKSSPTIQAAGSPPANAAGWNTGTVTVSFTCADSISGIAACPQNQTVSSDGANQIVSGSATDQAGNMASTSFTVNLDETPPILGATVSPTPNAAGWNNTNATVTFACNDSISGVASCPPPQTITSEVAGLAVSGTATDVAGNSTSTSVTVNVDKTPPIIVVNSPTDRSTLPAGTPSILVSGTGSDSVSGVAAVTCNGAPASLSGSNFSCMVPLSAGPNSISVQAKDIAGNANNSLVNVTVTTATAPQITITSPANLSVTNFSPVSVNGTVSDPAATLAINGIPVPQSSGSFSIPVPLVEGLNVLTAVATAASGITGTATVQVTLDTTPPHLSIDSPSDKAITTDATVTVTGSVNDIVPGTVNNQEAQVIVNGITAQVANRTYLAANVPLGLGANTIQATARDRAGNAATVSIGVTRVSASQPPAPPVGQAVVTNSLSIVSGNNQTASIGTQLPTPLAVLLSDASGHPVPDQPVVFKVTGNNGTVSAGGAAGSSLTVNTDANGLAQAAWTLGQRSGVGVNRLEVSSAVAIAPLNFNAIAMAGSPSAIVIDSGDNQTGIAGQALAFPLVVVVTDGGHNRIANVPVTFTASGGGGSLNGAPSQVINTDSDGRALAVLTLGPAAGTSNNTVEATFPGNPGSPVAFIGSAKIAGDPLKTTISGVVLDNTNTPIANATIRLFQTNQGNNNNLPIQIGTPVVTDAQGHFLIASAPVGYFKLMADGSTAGSYPTLEYDLNTIAGQDNTVGTPIYLPVLNTANQICIDETHGGTLTLAQYPGFSLAIAPGAATFPGGSRRGCVSVSTVHGDKVPMPPGFGQQPRFIVTIQPVGTTFNPPAAMTLPNVDGLKPRAKTEMYSYDHDLGMFIAIGTATVSDDGSVISSDPGTGVLKAGWHCGGDPNASGHVADCPSCQICSGSKCVPNPKAVPCNDQDNIVLDFSTPQLRDQKVHVVFDNSCKGSACQTESGTCAPNTGGFSIPLLKDGVQSALTKIYDNSATACIGEELRLQMQLNLEQYGIKINCNSDSNAGWCGQAENSQNADGSLSTTHTIDVNTTAMTGKGCAPEPLAAILLHEMLHAYGNDPGAPTLHWHDTVDTTISHPADCRDRVYGCEESCFPGSTARKGVGNPQACRLPQGDVNGKGDPGCNGLCIPFGDVVVCASH